MVATQRDTPDWVSQVSRAAFQVPNSPFTLAANGSRTVAVAVDSTIKTVYLMLRNVVGVVGYSIVGATSGFTYDGNVNAGRDQMLRVSVGTMFDATVNVTVTTAAASSVTVYIGVASDPESLTGTTTILNSAVPISGSVGITGTVPTNATITNPNIPIAANMTFLGTVPASSGGTSQIQSPVPSYTTAVYVLTDQPVNAYAVTIYSGTGTLGQVLYNDISRPRAQLSAFPLIVGVTPITINITNNNSVTTNYYAYAVVGALPAMMEPVEGLLRTEVVIVGTGWANFAGSPAAGSGLTTQFSIVAPSTQVLVVDGLSIFLDSNSAPANSQSRFRVTNPGGTTVGYLLELHAATTGQSAFATGPFYISPGSTLIGETYNNGTVVSVMNLTAAYHFQVQ